MADAPAAAPAEEKKEGEGKFFASGHLKQQWILMAIIEGLLQILEFYRCIYFWTPNGVTDRLISKELRSYKAALLKILVLLIY